MGVFKSVRELREFTEFVYIKIRIRIFHTLGAEFPSIFLDKSAEEEGGLFRKIEGDFIRS